MQLYLNHILGQATLNHLATSTYEIAPQAYELAAAQDLSLPKQMALLLVPGFCMQKLIPPTTIKEQTANLLRTKPDRYAVAVFLNAVHQELIVPDQPSLLTKDYPARYCLTLSFSVATHLTTMRDQHGNVNKPSMAINLLLGQYKRCHSSTPAQAQAQDPIYIHQGGSEADPIKHLTVTLTRTQFQSLLAIATRHNLINPRARNETGQASATIEAMVRGLI